MTFREMLGGIFGVPGLVLRRVMTPPRPPDNAGIIYVSQVDGKVYHRKPSGSDVSLEGGGTASPLTTKGDVWCYSTADARQAVGTDGYLFEADSSQATGLNWRKSQTARAASTVPRSTAEASLWGWAQPHSTREVWGLYQPRASGFDNHGVSVVQAGITTQSNQSDADGAFRGLATSGASGNGWNVIITLAGGLFAKTGSRASFVFRSDPTLFTANTRLWIGLGQANPGDAAAPGVTDSVFLRLSSFDSDTQAKVYTSDGTTNTAGSSFGPTLANDTVYRIDFEWTSATSITITVVDLDAGTSGSVTVTTTVPRTGQTLDFRVQMFTKSANVRRLDYGTLLQAMLYGPATYLG